ncbi:MAG: diguanylate cyclase [Oscillospiraceae bacterium]|nr:diguanylate cyclase [Oscillospiraceae bacterium]
MADTNMRNWVVVVDDEAVSLTSARTLLAAEDMKISCLPSGKSLLKFMEKNQPDLILLDVMMPEMDGFETFAALRELEQRQNRHATPIIFLTGEVDHETEQQGLKLGAADYIRKPFNRDTLIRRIRNTIQNRKMIVSLTEDATKDKLTGFLNKAEGVARIRDALAAGAGALLTLDIDSFKLVNDLHGHEMGDRILREFADLARVSTRDGDILCRMGGDEFLLFCRGMQEERALSALSARLNELLEKRAEQVLGAEHGIPLGISIGAVMVPEYGRDYEALFRMADEAMYLTKKNGKHGYTVYVDAKASVAPTNSPEEELTRMMTILAERNQGREALVLGADAFSAAFQLVARLNRSRGVRTPVLLFLVSAKNAEDNTALSVAAADFGAVLKQCLGISDVMMQSRNNRFVVLLPTRRESDAGSVINDVLSAWGKRSEWAAFEIKTAFRTM